MEFYQNDTGSWSIGTLLGLPVGIICIILFFVGSVLMFSKSRSSSTSSYDRRGYFWGGVVGFGGMIVTIGLLLWAMYPYSSEYHQYRDVGGTVNKVDSRIIAGDKASETKFVLRFEGSDTQFGCDDTRCAQVEKGDDLKLSCKRDWQYTGTDGYNCRFVSVTSNN